MTLLTAGAITALPGPYIADLWWLVWHDRAGNDDLVHAFSLLGSNLASRVESFSIRNLQACTKLTCGEFSIYKKT